jgi:hypothetical protein
MGNPWFVPRPARIAVRAGASRPSA